MVKKISSMMHDNTQSSINLFINTYDLVDAGYLRLEDGNSISDGWFFVSRGSGSESSGLKIY